MAMDRALERELAATFAVEVQERLRSLERDLLALETAPDGPAAVELLTRLTRDAHSLKGAAQVVALPDVSAVAHALEGTLGTMLRAEGPGGASLQPLFDTIASLGTLVNPSTAHTVDVAAAVSRLDPRPVPPARTRQPPRSTAGEDPRSRPRRAASRRSGAVPAQEVRGTGLWPQARESESWPAGPADATPVAPAEGPGAVAPPPDRAGTVLATDSVRVRTARLDGLLARGGELFTVEERAGRLHAEVRRLRGSVASWHRDWQHLRGTLESTAPADAAPPWSAVHSFAVEAGGRLQRLERDLGRLVATAAADRGRIAGLTAEVTRDALELRLVPAQTAFGQFPLMVRELARAAEKQVQLQELGWQTEVDRQILEQLKDPVMHLLRNAVDHGIETVSERLAAGKPATGTIVLETVQRGGGVVVEVRDDGRGIDPGRVRAAALHAGIPESGLPPASDAAATIALVLRGGVTTADTVTEVSGRGVGLDAVGEAVARMGGSVSLASEVGRGTRVTLLLPLTLMMAHVLLVRGHARRYALPIAAVERCLRLAPGDVTQVAGRETIRLEGETVPLTHLAHLVGDGEADGTDSCRSVVVVRSAGRTVGFVVREVIADRRVLARGLGDLLMRAGGASLVSGAALLGEDDLALILDPVQLIRAAEEHRARPSPAPHHAQAGTEERPAAVLIVDDSITTRTLEKSILEAAGFAVGVAVDGMAALGELRRARYDLVVADVDMPRMDGLELTRRVKSDPALQALPVILVSALESAEQQEQGLLAGADAYIPKSTFDQRVLLQTIRSVVG